MKSPFWTIAAGLAWTAVLAAFPVRAQVANPAVLIVPAERGSSLANNEDDAPLGNFPQHFQQIYSSALLSGIHPGDQITALGFRVTVDQTAVPVQVIPDYSIWLGQSAVAPSLMSLTFSQNRGAGFTQVRSGPLEVTSDLFPGGSGVNLIGMIEFGTPFTYAGGDLLIEVSYAPFPAGGRNVEAETGFDPNLAMTAFGHGANSTSAFASYNEALIMGLRVVPATPEPNMILPFLGGTALIFRRRREP